MKNLLRYRWTVTVAFLVILGLSGCGSKGDQSASNNTSPGTDSATQASPAANSNSSPLSQTSPGTGTTTAGKTGATPSASGVLSAEAKSLGVTPTGGNCPNDAPIKGKATKKRGDIYHVAKSPNYSQVKPDICFKDVATAEKAGFRAPK